MRTGVSYFFLRPVSAVPSYPPQGRRSVFMEDEAEGPVTMIGTSNQPQWNTAGPGGQRLKGRPSPSDYIWIIGLICFGI